jgi:hypothetical protein
MCFQCILDIPPSSFFCFLSPLPRTISTGFILLFSYMNTKYVHHIHPHSPFPYAPPTSTHPQKRSILPSSPPFLKKYIMIVEGGYTLVLQACVYYALIKLTPLLHHLLFLYHHAPLIFSSLQYGMLYYIHIQMGCFDIFYSLTFSFLLPPPVIPSEIPTNTSCSLSHCIFVYIYMIIYVFTYTFNL